MGAMKRFKLKIQDSLSRNKRNNLACLTFACALCVLVWQRYEPGEADDKTERGVQEQVAPTTTIELFTRFVPFNDTYSLRRQTVVDVCKHPNGPATAAHRYIKVPLFKENPIISRKHNLLFCPVGKVASSFLTRYFIAMEKPGVMTSPYDIPIEKAGRERCTSLRSLKTTANMMSFFHKSTKIVFGRNPYSRIFSAYIDKLFSPNPFYWKYWGERSLRLSRAMKVGAPCASDVTFQQFVKLVLFDLGKKDVHLRAVSAVCNMCGVVYDVIGKVETVGDDLDYLSEKFNISSAFQHADGYRLAASMDAVYDSVNSVFSWKRDVSRCISLDQMGLRVWRKLQIRGIIDSRVHFPFKPGQMADVTLSMFVDACRTAILNSTDRAQLKRQTNQAMLEAYSTVSVADLISISALYRDDMLMFGYEPKPSQLFEHRDAVKQTGYLKWGVPWVVS
ncbi:unnamed protein product [Lymnaea stagnalis]|uniref:Carbohydrate sulfotransferase n=1 Tax=Lymnaea stagnalis TaxID=6523 RepID=A0AAV2I3V1_LYMST